MWVFVKCRQCDAKRTPRRMPDGKIQPFDRHCRQCGTSAFRLVKRQAIDAYELQYCLSVKEVDYREERKPFQKPAVNPAAANAKQTPPSYRPFQQTRAPFSPAFDVVEGEVVRKRYYSQNNGSSVWEELPFPWSAEKQTSETPKNNAGSWSGFRPRRQIS